MLHYLDSTKGPFLGKALKAITRLADDAVCVEFGDGTKLKISVEGDCCSHSIFYAIDMPESLIGATLKDIDEAGWNEDSEAHRTADDEATALEKVKASGIEFSPEENRVWNVVLKTDRGNALIRHINSSNGYYDGSTEYEVLNSDPNYEGGN